MKERPILFSGEMVRAILEGRKTMTRRIVNGTEGGVCFYGVPGDKLWIREAWALQAIGPANHYCAVRYLADGEVRKFEGVKYPKTIHFKARPSIFMPRWASRITLEVTVRRAERLQDITEGDAFREGVERIDLTDGKIDFPDPISGEPFTRVHPLTGSYRDAFAALWDKINGKRFNAAWKGIDLLDAPLGT